MVEVAIEGVPFALSWQPKPVEWSADVVSLTLTAGERTDLFVDPATAAETLTAPKLLGPVTGDFALSARVTVDFRATFDAGVLLLWSADRAWAKLCFEHSPESEPMVVSVVTRDVSDDCNSFVVAGNVVRLRVARLGSAFAFHASTDGRRWQLIRHFTFDAGAELLAGFLAQSPLGSGCFVQFDEIAFQPGRLADLRSGV